MPAVKLVTLVASKFSVPTAVPKSIAALSVTVSSVTVPVETAAFKSTLSAVIFNVPEAPETAPLTVTTPVVSAVVKLKLALLATATALPKVISSPAFLVEIAVVPLMFDTPTTKSPSLLIVKLPA